MLLIALFLAFAQGEYRVSAQAVIEGEVQRALVAPFAGIVVTGDLSRMLGSPVEQGKVLFELAPLDAIRVRHRLRRLEPVTIERVRSGRARGRWGKEFKWDETECKAIGDQRRPRFPLRFVPGYALAIEMARWRARAGVVSPTAQ